MSFNLLRYLKLKNLSCGKAKFQFLNFSFDILKFSMYLHLDETGMEYFIM